MAGASPSRSAFSFLELLVTLAILGILAGMGASQLSSSALRIRQQAEAERLVACLKWLREMARSQGPGVHGTERVPAAANVRIETLLPPPWPNCVRLTGAIPAGIRQGDVLELGDQNNGGAIRRFRVLNVRGWFIGRYFLQVETLDPDDNLGALSTVALPGHVFRRIYASPGYGVFFWRNQVTGTCFQYSPYNPHYWTVPDDPRNDEYHRLDMLGRAQSPLAFGNLTPAEMQTAPAALLADGLSLYFQSDLPGQPNRTPNAVANYPNPPAPANSWNGFRVVFFPPGTRAPGFWTNVAGPGERGVVLPRFAAGVPGGWAYYNRIYVAGPCDNTAAGVLPMRIRIDPGTGIVRLMGQEERRSDGTW